MSGSAPTSPASIYHPARADAVQQLRCAIPSADDPVVLDFTRGGILIETSTRLRIGSEYVCALTLQGQSVSLPARVTHTRYQPPQSGRTLYQIGLAFRLTSPEHDQSLQTLSTLLGLRQFAA